MHLKSHEPQSLFSIFGPCLKISPVDVVLSLRNAEGVIQISVLPLILSAKSKYP